MSKYKCEHVLQQELRAARVRCGCGGPAVTIHHGKPLCRECFVAPDESEYLRELNAWIINPKCTGGSWGM